ncbi:acyl-CoA dehydrogenase family protein [Novosphingopyxis baekryungensis]|uniref:acyl-CoA dehydrogenase family protein n=1 Tax=Novosphingopyxis baekryungensis TaxID=279369 RepID=UPI0003B3D299|nr:acyl-CoA dehydrogenase family protein [Novosphingopyxis baekryungensis]
MAILSEEQTMLRDMAREWTKKENPVGAFRKVRDEKLDAGYEPAVYAQMAEMGWAGVIIPEEQGGSDFGYMSLGLVLEETGRSLTASPLLASALGAASALILGGSDDQKSHWLPKIASGEIVGTLAVDEGPRHNPAKTEVSVSGGKLSGTKTFVPEGMSAGLFIVSAADGVYLVDGADGGVSRSDRSMVDQRGWAEVTFDGAAAQKLEGGGDDLLDQILDRARIGAAAEMLGMASQAFDVTLAYLKQRVQFNQVLSSFQALQHRMADLFGEIELMRSAVENGLTALDDKRGDIAMAASQAKAVANDAIHHMSKEAVQLHGGIGMTDEYDIGFYLKRARTLEQLWGSSAFHRERFARLNDY